MQMIAATGNKNKLEEFQRILSPLGIDVLSLADTRIVLDVEETGATFAENAYIKAKYIQELTGKPVLADDSGLCVDFLGGRPGVYSARYQGEDTPYPQKMAALLLELEGAAPSQRGAQFVAAICCLPDDETVIACEGVCAGTIGYAPTGTGGFGYDPLFMMGEQSFAELAPQEKDACSHRGKALRELVRRLTIYNKDKEQTI